MGLSIRRLQAGVLSKGMTRPKDQETRRVAKGKTVPGLMCSEIRTLPLLTWMASARGGILGGRKSPVSPDSSRLPMYRVTDCSYASPSRTSVVGRPISPSGRPKSPKSAEGGRKSPAGRISPAGSSQNSNVSPEEVCLIIGCNIISRY